MRLFKNGKETKTRETMMHKWSKMWDQYETDADYKQRCPRNLSLVSIIT